MYEEYFGLKELPFHITPDPKFIFMSNAHREGLNHLLYGIKMRKGFLALIGEVGMGKTTLYRFLFEKLGPAYPTAVVLNPLLTGKQMITAILRDFDVPVTSIGRTGEALVDKLNRFLKSKNEEKKIPLLVVDEAHQLPDSLLELLRILSNYETNRQKLLQILMVGQPELLRRLSSPALRQLNQRINVRCYLGGLEKDEVNRYIEHRLTVGGNNGSIRFTPGANRVIRKSSRGVPRLVNQICDRALLSAFVHGVRVVRRRDVREAIVSLEGGCSLSPLSFHGPSGSESYVGSSNQRLKFCQLSPDLKIGVHV